MNQLPFIPGHIYNRRTEIHGVYGGNPQSGISTSAKYAYIFIFTGTTGHKHGYKDRWDNPNVFSYTGEGQVGDMKFTKGNSALRDHVKNEKRVFLFESDGRGPARFICEVICFDVDYLEIPDTQGNMRLGIKFFFKKAGAYISIAPELVKCNYFADIGNRAEILMPTVTERKGLVTSRVGQGAYRKRIIHRWEYQCAVTGFDKLDVLIASHIVPWSESDNNQRLDVDNGILLSPTYDALFDRKLISFEDSGKIILSPAIELTAYNKIGVTGSETIKSFSSNNLVYLGNHRNKFHDLL